MKTDDDGGPLLGVKALLTRTGGRTDVDEVILQAPHAEEMCHVGPCGGIMTRCPTRGQAQRHVHHWRAAGCVGIGEGRGLHDTKFTATGQRLTAIHC